MSFQEMTRSDESIPQSGMNFPCQSNESFGVPVEVAEGVWWIRLPVDLPLESVNVYALKDDDGLTLIDTGSNDEETIKTLDLALNSAELKGLPLRRVIVTHFHPDHIGLAGYLANQHDASLWMTRTCWLTCNLLLRTSSNVPSDEAVRFMRKAGLPSIQLEAYRRQTSGDYRDAVAPLADHYVPLIEGETIKIGSRTWTIINGNGHAAEHATFWTEDLAIVGDQILPSISASLTVPFTEPESDLVAEWLQSCSKLSEIADNQLLVLPGHQLPYTGCHNRLLQIQTNVEAGLQRIGRLLVNPRNAFDFVETFHNRSMTVKERKRMLPEMVGFLNHLVNRGELECMTGTNDEILFGPAQSKRTSNPTRPVATTVLTGKSTMQSKAAAGSSEASPPNQTRPEKQKTMTVIQFRTRTVVAAMLLLAVSGLAYASRDRWMEQGTRVMGRLRELTNLSTAIPPRNELGVPVVVVQTIVPEKLSSTELPRRFTGTVKAKRTSEVGFNRIGTIDSILVERGERIAEGRVLATLNKDLLQANLKAIDAQIEAASARLEEMLAGPRSQTIDKARNEVSAAQAELDLAQTSSERSQRLVSIGAVSKQAVDEASSQLKGKQESLNAAQNALNELLSGTRSEQVRGQRAVLAELDASKEQAEVQLVESIVAAPFDAIVAERYLSPGSVVSPGEPVVRLVEVAPPEAWIGLPPKFIDRLTPDQKVVVKIGSRSVDASLIAVLPELDSGTRTNTAVFELTGLEPGWGIGRSVEIELTKPMNQSGFWVPMSSIIKGDHGLWAVFALEAIEKSDTARLVKRELEVILVDSDRAYVRGTLQEGEPVVATGLHRLTPGQIVRVQPELAHMQFDSSKDASSL